MDVHIRWMILKDMDTVLQIERSSFSEPWSRETFERRLRQRNAIGMVAEVRHVVVGFMVYELFRHHLDLVNLAVAPMYRMSGVGTALINKLASNLSTQRRRYIEAVVPDYDLDAHLFLKAMGFQATGVSHEAFEDSDGMPIDGYRMVRVCEEMAGSVACPE